MTRKHILWVDDKPSNNAFLIDKLRKDGVEVTESLSTDEALTFLGKNTKDIDVIISDMSRFEHGQYQPEAGLKLITSTSHLGIPILVFSSARYARQNSEAVRKAGAKGVTASSLELLEWLKELGVG
jgi:CheY-like chemotaxis protein